VLKTRPEDQNRFCVTAPSSQLRNGKGAKRALSQTIQAKNKDEE